MPELGRRRATLSDVAREAGVSVPTVSKVVKGRTDVSAETRTRILTLLREHGYVPRGGSDGRPSTTIELSFDGLENANNLETMRGVLETAERAGVHVVVRITPKNGDGDSWAGRMLDAHHSGMILVTSRLSRQQQQDFANAGIPIIVIDPVNTPADDLPSVGVNNFTGGYLATKHLIDLGHSKIAMVQGVDSECAGARLGGYHSALRDAGIAARPEYLQPGAFRFEDGKDAGARLLELQDPPTAIFAANDLEALGVLDAAHTRGIRVPEELSVVGFDDSLQAISASPHLTTVRQPFAEIGATAAQLLLQIIEGEPLASRRLELATQVVIRDSTAAPSR